MTSLCRPESPIDASLSRYLRIFRKITLSIAALEPSERPDEVLISCHDAL
jgi:hypothetical protein